MRAGQDADGRTLDLIPNQERKSVQDRAADTAVYNGIDQRRLREADHDRGELVVELPSQAGLLLLVLVLGLLNVELGRSTEADRKSQGNRLRRRA